MVDSSGVQRRPGRLFLVERGSGWPFADHQASFNTDGNYSAAKTRHDDFTAKHADEAMPDVQSLLLERRDVIRIPDDQLYIVTPLMP